VNPSMEKCIPRFEHQEVELGEMLGSGGFNDVYEVKCIRLIDDLSQAEHAKKISSPLQSEHRAFVAKHTFRESSQNCRYAVKFLSVETMEDPNRFCTGAADLVVVRLPGRRVFRSKPQSPLYLRSSHVTIALLQTGSKVLSIFIAPKHYQAARHGRSGHIWLRFHGRAWLLSPPGSTSVYT
jgi:hypothetical protein